MEPVSNERYQEKAALGLAFRALGQEMKGGIGQLDLVTEMRFIKHPYKAGIKAQRGVEF